MSPTLATINFRFSHFVAISVAKRDILVLRPFVCLAKTSTRITVEADKPDKSEVIFWVVSTSDVQ